MPLTVSHVVFALSFASAFFACYLGSRFLVSVLDGTGHDFFATILGHENQPENMPSPSIQDFSNNQFAQLFALVLTAATSVFIYLKFSQSESNLVCIRAKCNEADVCPPESKKPVLDPQNWQDFPLVKKTIVSPNTAM